MITVISSSNRSNSEGLKFARRFDEMFAQRVGRESVQLLSMEDLPKDMVDPYMYSRKGQHAQVAKIQDQYMTPVEKWFFVIPEYNGGFPGIVKLFLDACSVRNYHETFHHKKAALVGIASGRAGNLRGMEHMTGVLNYLGVVVMPNKLPISRIETLMDEKGEITDVETLKSMEQQVKDFIEF